MTPEDDEWHCSGHIRGVIDLIEVPVFKDAIASQFTTLKKLIGDDIENGWPAHYVCTSKKPEPTKLFQLIHTELGLATIWTSRRNKPKGVRHPTTLWITDPANGIEGVFHLDADARPLDIPKELQPAIMPWLKGKEGIIQVPQSNHHLMQLMEDPATQWSAMKCAERRAIYAQVGYT